MSVVNVLKHLFGTREKPLERQSIPRVVRTTRPDRAGDGPLTLDMPDTDEVTRAVIHGVPRAREEIHLRAAANLVLLQGKLYGRGRVERHEYLSEVSALGALLQPGGLPHCRPELLEMAREIHAKAIDDLA